MAGSSLVSYPLVDLLYPGLLGASLGCLGLQIKPKTKKITILRILGGDGGGGGGVHADPRIKLPPGKGLILFLKCVSFFSITWGGHHDAFESLGQVTLVPRCS